MPSICKSSIRSACVAVAILLCTGAVHAAEKFGMFENGSKSKDTVQATQGSSPSTRQINQKDCRDALSLYTSVSAVLPTRQRAADALIETISRHETLQRIALIAGISGCDMSPFLAEEVRRFQP